jgi:hypothetical protein
MRFTTTLRFPFLFAAFLIVVTASALAVTYGTLINTAGADEPTPFVKTIETFTVPVTTAPYTSGTYDLTKGQVPANTLLLMRVKREGTDYSAEASSFRVDFDTEVSNRVVVHRTTGDAPFYATVTAVEFDPDQVNVYKQEWTLNSRQLGSNPDLRDENMRVYADPDETKAIAIISYTATGSSTKPSSYYVSAYQSGASHVVIRRGSTNGVTINGYYTTIEARGDQFRAYHEGNGLILGNATSSTSGSFSKLPVERDRTALFTTMRTSETEANLGSLGFMSHLAGTGPTASQITYERGGVSSNIRLRPSFATEVLEFLQGDTVSTGLVSLLSVDLPVAVDQTGVDTKKAVAGATSGGAAIYPVLNTSSTDQLNIGYMNEYFIGTDLILDHTAVPNQGNLETYWQVIHLRTQE